MTQKGRRSGTTTDFTGRLSEGVQQEASMSQAIVSLLHLDGKSGDEGESPPAKPKLDPSNRQVRIPKAVKCLRCSTCERSSHRPSRIPTDGGRFDEKPVVDVCVTWLACLGTETGGFWQLISTGFGGHTLQDSLEGAEVRAELFPIRMNHFVQTDGNESRTQANCNCIFPVAEGSS